MIGDGHQPDSVGVYIHVRRIRYRRWDFLLKVGRLWSPKKFYTFPRTQRWRTSNAWWNSRWTNQRKCHVCSGPSSMFTGFLWVVSKICFQDIRSITLITIIHVAQGTGTFPESVKWFPSENVGWHWKRRPHFSHFFSSQKGSQTWRGSFFSSLFHCQKHFDFRFKHIKHTPKSKQFNLNFQAFSMWEMAVIWKMDENGWRLLANLPSASFSDFEDNRVVVRVDLED